MYRLYLLIGLFILIDRKIYRKICLSVCLYVFAHACIPSIKRWLLHNSELWNIISFTKCITTASQNSVSTQFHHYSVCAWSWGCHLQSCVFHAFNVFPALIAIGRYSMTIETVDVGWCKEITDRGATQIAQRSKSLRYLGLMRCDQVRSLCLSWCLSLSVRVFLCECEDDSRIYEHIHYSTYSLHIRSIHYWDNCSGVLCSHTQLKSHPED